MKYAAFIITYRRVDILKKTIVELLNQSLPPSRILIVDNDPDSSALNAIDDQKNSIIDYFSVGLNSGPSGGAYWGLKKLFEQGWEWVLWIDDDDPPSAVNQLETILSIKNIYPFPEEIGVLGASGVLFNYDSFRINRIPDSQLSGILEVDMVAGNQFPFIHRRVYESGILPNSKLFFGFEDLEFGLRVKELGLKLLVNGEEVLRLRKHFNKYGKEKQRGLKKKTKHLWREYYSTRTISYILKNKNRNLIMIKYSLFSLLKILQSFRFGLMYGFVCFKYILYGLIDGFRGKLGLTVLPIKKY